jgi:benzoylformate decarboxylase
MNTPRPSTVREAVYELLRANGIDTVFGNPGSTELSLLRDFPPDLRYVLGLQEAVVVGMADGWAARTGKVGIVSVHTAAGLGNAMGAIINARDNRTPLVVIAGQQHRDMLVCEPMLSNPDGTTLPRPAVKWAHEPSRAADLPLDLARAIRIAQTQPYGPVFLSTPMDDLDAELSGTDLERFDAALARSVTTAAHVADDAITAIADQIDAAANPALVFGSETDADGAHDAAVALAEATGATVYSAPLTGRVGFPQRHPQYAGALEPAIGLVARALAPHDLAVVLGAPVFQYYPYVPGPWLAEGTRLIHITSSAAEACRAPIGDAWAGHVGAAVAQLAKRVGNRREPRPPRPGPEALYAALARLAPPDTVWFLESPSNQPQFFDQIRPHRQGSCFTSAGGGLGYGLAAAVGGALAGDGRPVAAVIGDGSAQYAITALWTAARYGVPLPIVVPCNDEYAILKWFAGFERTPGVPGLDIGGLDMESLARGYGVRALRTDNPDTAAAAFVDALSADGPTLISVPITTVMPTIGEGI